MLAIKEQERSHLFQQIMVSTGFLLVVFIESVLGQIPSLYGNAPRVTFCVLFLVSCRNPSLIPIYPLVAFGLIYDVLQGSPMGYTSSLYLIIYFAARWRRQIINSSDGTVRLIEFISLCCVLFTYEMLIFGLYQGAWPPFAEIAFQGGFTILLFLFITMLMRLLRYIASFLGFAG